MTAAAAALARPSSFARELPPADHQLTSPPPFLISSFLSQRFLSVAHFLELSQPQMSCLAASCLFFAGPRRSGLSCSPLFTAHRPSVTPLLARFLTRRCCVLFAFTDSGVHCSEPSNGHVNSPRLCVPTHAPQVEIIKLTHDFPFEAAHGGGVHRTLARLVRTRLAALRVSSSKRTRGGQGRARKVAIPCWLAAVN